MINFSDKTSLKTPWWTNTDQDIITTFDYPAERSDDAKRYIADNNLTLNLYLHDIIQHNYDDMTCTLKIAQRLQAALIHNPVFQPSEKRPLSLKSTIASALGLTKIRKRQLIFDSLLLLTLGEARCGQAARVFIECLKRAGIKAKIEHLHNHIIANVRINNTEYLIDIDAFKNNIFFFKDTNTLLTRKEILKNPKLIDRFKHTGWMFQKNARYAKNKDNVDFSGYIDFFMPENDGLISHKFGDKDHYHPPGIPLWDMPSDAIAAKENENINCSFTVPFEKRADYFLVKICKKTKGYNYDHLVYKNLTNETSDVIENIKLKETNFTFSIPSCGEYYITICAMSEHLEQNNCYTWWSDELKITIK